MNWENYNFVDYLNIKKNEISNLPNGVKISTMCCSCKDGLGTNINLENILKYMELSRDDIIQIKKDENNIRTLIPKKNLNEKQKK